MIDHSQKLICTLDFELEILRVIEKGSKDYPSFVQPGTAFLHSILNSTFSNTNLPK